jgi:hypothetical protein
MAWSTQLNNIKSKQFEYQNNCSLLQNNNMDLILSKIYFNRKEILINSYIFIKYLDEIKSFDATLQRFLNILGHNVVNLNADKTSIDKLLLL